MMARTKTTNRLPLGVSAVANRPGLYRLSVMIHGQRYSEYYRPDEQLTQRHLQSALQKAVDTFREKAERGSLRGQVTDKSRFSEAVDWYLSMAKMELRESTMRLAERTFAHYLTPTLGNVQLRSITSPMITQLLSDLSEHGGGQTVYIANPSFIETLKAQTVGKVYPTADKIGIGENTICRVRSGKTVSEQTTTLTAKYFDVPLGTAFERREETEPLKATFVNRISTQLSAFFTALVKNEVLTKNPVITATKPRVGESERGAYLDNIQLSVFLTALYIIADDNVKVCLSLCLKLGLRSGEARALRWRDVDFNNAIVHIDHSVAETNAGLLIGEPKTKRSIRKLPAGHVVDMLAYHKTEQDRHAALIGSAWTDNGLVCPNQSGGIMNRSQPYSAVVGIARKNKELPPKLHPHSLRHSFVSMLISQGVDIVHVASLAGDTVEVIAKVYAHAFAEREAAAMDRIGGVFAQLNTTAPKLIPTHNLLTDTNTKN
jgi:integrase